MVLVWRDALRIMFLVGIDALDLNIGKFDVLGFCLFVEHILYVSIELVTLISMLLMLCLLII